MKLTKKQTQMLSELKKSNHNISIACEVVGIARTTHYGWLQNATYKKESEDIQDGLLDQAEAILQDRIKESDTALIFFLKTKGKKRGYVEKQEVDSTSSDGSMTPQTTIVFSPVGKDD